MPINFPIQQQTTNNNALFLYLVNLVNNLQAELDTFLTAAAPILQGNLDCDGHNIFDSTGSVTINDSLVVATPQLDYQQTIGIPQIIGISGGSTWTVSRAALGQWSYNKTAATDNSILGFDITPIMRTTSNKGYELTSFNVFWTLTGANLNSHSASLTQVTAGSGTYTTTAIVLTGSGTLSSATGTGIIEGSCPLTTPAYLNSNNSKYIIELSINAPSGSSYSFFGITLNFNYSAF